MGAAWCCPTTHSPAGCPVGAAALLIAAARCGDQCSGSTRSPVVRSAPESCGWTSSATHGVSVTMENLAATDPEVSEFVVQLCTRLGMIMEDVTVLALDASHEGLEQRVTELAKAAQTIAAVADAAQSLLSR